MKKLFGTVLIIIIALFSLSACDPSGQVENNEYTPPKSDTPATISNVLIAYFSCTGTTEAVAGHIEAKTGGTLYEIVPQIPYTAEDLAYYTGGRADKEQNDPAARPAISGSVENMEEYDAVFLGYPIWLEQAPKIIYTFLESYDFSGKTIIPFCTSGGSPIGSSVTNLHPLATGATWLDGRRFPEGVSESAVGEWIDSLNVISAKDKEETVTNEIFLTIGEHKISVTLEKNAAADALLDSLKTGDISYAAHDYGGFEKVGSLGRALPSDDRRMTTKAGDVILYSGDQIVLFYGSNSWSYTKLGEMRGLTAEQIRDILTKNETVTVKISIN